MTATTRPFHETIIEAIRVCGPASSGRIFILTRLIRDTAISEGHYKIIVALDEYFDFPGAEKYARDIREVKESLLTQINAVREDSTKTLVERALMNIIDMIVRRHHDGRVALDEGTFELFELAKCAYMSNNKNDQREVLDKLAKFKK